MKLDACQPLQWILSPYNLTTMTGKDIFVAVTDLPAQIPRHIRAELTETGCVNM